MSTSASYHDVHLVEDKNRAILWQTLTPWLMRYVSRTDSALELGAGYCYWINAIPARRRVAVDLWDRLPEFAAPGVEAVIQDLSDGVALPGHSPFDVALASNLFEHFDIDRLPILIKSVTALLSAGGRLIVIQPNFRTAYRSYFDDYTHRSIHTDVSLPNLLRAHGLEIVHVAPRFMPYSLKESRLPVHPLLIKLYLAMPFKPLAGQMLIVARKPDSGTQHSNNHV